MCVDIDQELTAVFFGIGWDGVYQFFAQVLSIAVILVVKDIVAAPKPQGNVTSGSHLTG